MIDEKIFIQKALKSYDNPSCISVENFKMDLDRFSHLKKILNKYSDGSGLINERLVLNHLIICFNLFGSAALELLFYKTESRTWGTLIPFLLFLNRIQDTYVINGQIPVTDIELDQELIEKLRKI